MASKRRKRRLRARRAKQHQQACIKVVPEYRRSRQGGNAGMGMHKHIVVRR